MDAHFKIIAYARAGGWSDKVRARRAARNRPPRGEGAERVESKLKATLLRRSAGPEVIVPDHEEQGVVDLDLQAVLCVEVQ